MRLLARLRSLPTASCEMSARVPEIKYKCQLHFNDSVLLQPLPEMHYTWTNKSFKEIYIYHCHWATPNGFCFLSHEELSLHCPYLPKVHEQACDQSDCRKRKKIYHENVHNSQCTCSYHFLKTNMFNRLISERGKEDELYNTIDPTLFF